MAIAAVAAIGSAYHTVVSPALQAPQAAPQLAGPSFADLLSQGLQGVDAKVAKADALMSAYAMGESIPVHQVTIALEEARIAVEMAVQVRERLTETYRSFMNMQL